MMHLIRILCVLIYVKCVQSTNKMTSDGLTSVTGMKDEDLDVVGLKQEYQVEYLEVQEKQRFKREANNPDPELKDLWHLTSDGVTYPLNIEQAWAQGYTGKGVVIAVVDTPVQTDHRDLQGNVDVANSYDYYNDISQHNPSSLINHGTMVAGLIAGVKGNNFCSVGVAYNATLIAVAIYEYLLMGAIPDQLLVQGLSHNSSIVDIYHTGFDDIQLTHFRQMGPLVKAAIESAIANGRGGKGCIYVSGAGSLGSEGNGNTVERHTLIYTITITSVKDKSSVFYGEFGAHIMAAAYGGSSRDRYLTTIITGDRCRTPILHLTSHASAIGAGIIALALEANPDLTWRDVQHLIARTSRRYGITDWYRSRYTWQRNGRGFYVHPKFGFGLMNAEGMVNMAKKWRTVATQQTYTSPLNTDVIISTNGVYGEDAIMVPRQGQPIRFLEHVTATVALNYTERRGLIEINLISPSGLTSPLLTLSLYDSFATENELSWTFKSVHFWGENPTGNWRFQFRSVAKVAVVTLESWSLKLYGTTTNPRWWSG